MHHGRNRFCPNKGLWVEGSSTGVAAIRFADILTQLTIADFDARCGFIGHLFEVLYECAEGVTVRCDQNRLAFGKSWLDGLCEVRQDALSGVFKGFAGGWALGVATADSLDGIFSVLGLHFGLVLALPVSVEALIEVPVFGDRGALNACTIHDELEGLLCADEAAGERDVDIVDTGDFYANRLGIELTLFREVDIHPTGEEIKGVPNGLGVSDEQESSLSISVHVRVSFRGQTRGCPASAGASLGVCYHRTNSGFEVYVGVIGGS